MGCLMVLAAWLLRDSDPAVAASLVLILWVWLSGGIHLDGLADTLDAWVGGLGSRERTLEIMKDPRSGPAAVTAIGLVLIAKWSSLQALITTEPWLLFAIPLLARMQLPLLLLTTPYARQRGMAADQCHHLPRSAAWIAVFATLIGCPLIFGWIGVILVSVSLLVFGLARRAMLQRLAGFTGDTAGALVELTETLLLLTIAL